MSDEYAPGKHPNSLANLKMFEPGHPVDHDHVVAAGRAGGNAKKRKRLLREAFRDILDAPLCGAAADEEQILELLGKMGVPNPTNADAIAFAAARKALAGDVEAARFVRDSVGEKPVQGVEVGNLDDRPFETLNLTELTDEQLYALAAKRQE